MDGGNTCAIEFFGSNPTLLKAPAVPSWDARVNWDYLYSFHRIQQLCLNLHFTYTSLLFFIVHSIVGPPLKKSKLSNKTLQIKIKKI